MQEIKSVKIEDEGYPENLKKIKDAPKVLYYRGVLPDPKEKCFANIL